MRRSVRWTLFASVMAALALFVAACGGSDNSSSTGGGGAAATIRWHRGQGGQAGWHPDLPRRRRHRLPRPGPDVLHVRLHGPVRDQPDAVLVQARRLGQAGAGPRRRARPRSRRTTRRSRSTSRRAIKYAPPVNREVKTADIKYAFERAFSKEVPNGYAGTYFSSIVGTPEKPNTGDIKPISGIETPDDTTIVFKLKTASAPLVSQALVMPITVPVPEEYAQEVRREHPVEVRPVRRLHRPVHGQERPQDGQGDRPRAGQVDHDRPQPQLGQVDRLPSRLPRRDQHRGGQRRPGDRRAPRAERLGHRVLRRRLAAGPGAQAGRAAATRTRSLRAVGRHALHRVQHDGQAVRQHQHPQGDHRGLRPQRAAPDARRRDPR